LSPQPTGQNRQVRGVINTIAGGFDGGGSSASARKRHLRVVQVVNMIIVPIRRTPERRRESRGEPKKRTGERESPPRKLSPQPTGQNR